MRILLTALILPVLSAAQGLTASGSLTTSGRPFMGPVVTGAPFSAQRVTEHVQVGSDGTRFTQTGQEETIYRDSQGRVRTERRMGPAMSPNVNVLAPVLVEIQDPVCGCAYTLETQNKIAHRTKLQTPEMRRMAATSAGAPAQSQITGALTEPTLAESRREGVFSAAVGPPIPGAGGGGGAPIRARVGASMPLPEFKQEDLGQQTMEGVIVTGRRTLQTFPTGAMGNDRPFQVVNETWTSPDLKDTVLSKTTDPRSGENTTKLTNINRSEPPADLFLPPTDYQVVDGNGPFEIRWSTPRQ